MPPELKMFFSYDDLTEAFGGPKIEHDLFRETPGEPIAAFLLEWGPLLPDGERYLHMTIVNEFYVSEMFPKPDVFDEVLKLAANGLNIKVMLHPFESEDPDSDSDKTTLVHITGGERNYLYLVPLNDFLENWEQFI